ncbi:MAG: hypothetical protein NT074_00580 [Methanomicrobiales archaeon]|jgi:hypothetical protein|nr:hypothetical protein [Methanomicrobiales archaeon]
MAAHTTREEYRELARLADRLLAKAKDRQHLAVLLDELDPAIQVELLCSDLLNAHQVFVYAFREEPDCLARERMELEPASALTRGITISEYDLAKMIFSYKDGEGTLTLTEGGSHIATFRGRTAYRDISTFLAESF